MNTPLVSVVIATYNATKYIDEQLESILNQTYQNIEIIILDDDSTDNTLSILEHYAKRYPHIKVIKNNNRLGVIKNFEKGISIANGDFIALCDQDDIWIEDKLLQQVESIKDYKIPALVHSDLEVIDSNGKTVHKSFFDLKGYSFSSKKSLSIMISRSGIMGNTILFNQALKDIILPFYDNIPMHDYYIGVLNEIYGKRITINKTLVKYRIHNANVGNRKKTHIEKIKGFFSHNLPYIDRQKFLNKLLEEELDSDDKIVIKDFLKCIRYDNFLYFIQCLKRDYFKNDLWYRVRLLLRYIIELQNR